MYCYEGSANNYSPENDPKVKQMDLSIFSWNEDREIQQIPKNIKWLNIKFIIRKDYGSPIVGLWYILAVRSIFVGRNKKFFNLIKDVYRKYI